MGKKIRPFSCIVKGFFGLMGKKGKCRERPEEELKIRVSAVQLCASAPRFF